MTFVSPAPMVRVGGRDLPTFVVLGVTGVGAGLIAGWVLGLYLGLPPGSLVAVSLAGTLAVLVDIVFQAGARGYVNLIAMRHVAELTAVTSVVCVLSGEPVGRMLDVVAVAVMPALAIGRIGCLAAGCCHGRRSLRGVRYRPDHVELGFPAELVGHPLVPVQLWEAGCLAVLGVLGAGLATTDIGATSERPGTTFGAIAIGYGLVRSVLELHRGDREPRWSGALTTPQKCSVGIALGILGLTLAGFLPTWELWPASALLLLLVSLWLTARRSRQRKDVDNRIGPSDSQCVSQPFRLGEPTVRGGGADVVPH